MRCTGTPGSIRRPRPVTANRITPFARSLVLDRAEQRRRAWPALHPPVYVDTDDVDLSEEERQACRQELNGQAAPTNVGQVATAAPVVAREPTSVVKQRAIYLCA